jgi:hypothetical protein
MNLYQFHKNPHLIHGHKQADEVVPDIVWNKYSHDPKELKKREDALAKDPEYAYMYALDILKKPWPKGEATIAKNHFIIVNINDF